MKRYRIKYSVSNCMGFAEGEFKNQREAKRWIKVFIPNSIIEYIEECN